MPVHAQQADATGQDSMVLRIDGISKTYVSNGRSVEAICEATFRIGAGQLFALRGKSGCGKSTLLLAAGSLLRPNRGTVVIQGQDPYAMPPDRRAVFRATHVGFVFQQFHLVPYLSVLDNVLTATLGRTDGNRASARDRALELIEQFGLTARIRHRPGQLSTGERQRTALARALLNQPRLLLADEPTGNLDQENSAIVLQHLQRYAGDGSAVLLATHDDWAAGFAQVSLTMTDGRVQQG